MTKGKSKIKKNNPIKNKAENATLDPSTFTEKLKKTSISELNTILKGEYMAIDSYEKYIDNISDANAKSELQKIQKEHKTQAISLAERVQNLGGIPTKNIGVIGKVAETISDIADITKSKPSSYIKKALNGENQGIKLVDEMIKGDLDNDSKNLVNSMLNQDKSHVNILSGLSTSLESTNK
ncbi:DUF2383 domain-containing protein [Clostridium akagii]|uniref:DUF2383 domain-containing protein n=1 Tax=Clostridium akagii TaxID=91623 RepID=UPI00068D91B8|nr:DUF2383 domain-containing protein [Clostridium akagii]